MAYDKKFAACILVNDIPVKETTGKIYLDSKNLKEARNLVYLKQSDYKLRLINKSDSVMKVAILVNGTCPDLTGLDALELLNYCDFIVIDSLNTLVPKTESDKGFPVLKIKPNESEIINLKFDAKHLINKILLSFQICQKDPIASEIELNLVSLSGQKSKLYENLKDTEEDLAELEEIRRLKKKVNNFQHRINYLDEFTAK